MEEDEEVLYKQYVALILWFAGGDLFFFLLGAQSCSVLIRKQISGKSAAPAM